MQAWILAGVRVDVELAVALEVGVLELTRAESPAERERALAFNRALWTLAGNLAVTSPRPEDCAQLRAAAARLAGAEADAFAEANRHFARLLAGRVSSAGALRGLMDQWRTFRSTHGASNFGCWLLDRMSGLDHHGSQRLAA